MRKSEAADAAVVPSSGNVFADLGMADADERASYQIVSLVGSGVFRSNVSVALALEYEEVLKRGDLISALTDEDVDRFLDYIFQSSNLVPSVYPMRPTLSDPDDELVLDLAIQCGGVIVTYNKRDFVEAGKRRVLVLAPAEFLDLISQTE